MARKDHVRNPNPSPATRFTSGHQPDGHKRPQDLMRKLRELDALEAPVSYGLLQEIRGGFVKYIDPIDGTETFEKVPVRERREAATSLLEWARGKPTQSMDVQGGLEVDLVGMLNEKIADNIGKMLGGK